MIIAVLPDQKKDLAEPYPENEFNIFTIRELSKYDGYLRRKILDSKIFPRTIPFGITSRKVQIMFQMSCPKMDVC